MNNEETRRTINEYYDESNNHIVSNLVEFHNEFISAIEKDDPYRMNILKGHLLLENALESLLIKYYGNKDYYERLKLRNFYDKLKILYSLNLISTEYFSAISKFNTLRNNYSHNFNYSITEKDLNDLISCLEKESKISYEERLLIYESKNLLNRLNLFMGFLFSNIKALEYMIHNKKLGISIQWESEFYNEFTNFLHNKNKKKG